MVVHITIIVVSSIPSTWRGVLDSILCDNDCELLWWQGCFSPVALNTNNNLIINS